MTGFVYAIACAGRIKLGYSGDPESRHRKISSDTPFACELLGYWPGTPNDERAIHDRFRAHHAHREWFEAAPEIVEFVHRESIMVAKIKKDMTDAALASKVGCDRSMITKIRAGTATPSLRLAAAISRETGIAIEALLPALAPTSEAAE